MDIQFPSTDNLDEYEKKDLTLFEELRAAAQTFDELVDLGRKRGMDYPEEWAKHVLAARNNYSKSS